MAFGLTATGFSRKRLTDILPEMIARIETDYGPINQDTRSVIMQLLAPSSEQFVELWELAEGVYLGLYPATAEGVQLDNVANILSLTRIAAAKSVAVLAATGTEATVVPLGNQFSASSTAAVFESDGAVTITKADVVRIDIQVDGVENSKLYTITIDSVDHDFTSDASATALEIRDGLKAAVNAGSSGMTAYDGATDADLYLQSDDDETGYDVDVSAASPATLAITAIATPIPITALVTGPVLVNATIIDTIVNPVSGLTSVSNLAEGTEGRDVEADAELRIRVTEAIQGAATVEAIRSRLLDEVAGVSTVTVIDNREDITVGGLPPHSFKAIVQGGDDQEIADKIWEVGPAGIETEGSTTKTVVDSMGNNQTIKFSRPTSQYAHVKATLTLYSEESLGSGAEDAIKAAILAFGDAFRIGEDMLWQRFLGPIFGATPGIQSIVMDLDVTPNPGDSPSYVTDTDVAIADDELAVFALTRITIVGIP